MINKIVEYYSNARKNALLILPNSNPSSTMTSDTPRTDAAWKAAFRSTSIDAESIRDFAQILERELNTLRWIPITERLPTIEDGNGFEDVEWSDGKDIWQDNYTNPHTHSATHWRRITLP